MSKILKQMVKSEIQKFISENKEFFNDYYDICNKLLMFEMKWGVGIGIIFNKQDVCTDSRGLNVEDLITKQTMFRKDRFKSV